MPRMSKQEIQQEFEELGGVEIDVNEIVPEPAETLDKSATHPYK